MRAFIAVELSDEVRQRLSGFASALAMDGVAPVEAQNLHITLFFLGEIDDRTKGKVISAMARVSSAPFELHVAGTGVFPNPNFIRVAWAGCESSELEKIYAQLAPEMRRLRYEVEEFRPHVTVARVKSPGAKEKVRDVLKSFEAADFGRCGIKSIVLKKSVLTPKGPVYSTVYEKRL